MMFVTMRNGCMSNLLDVAACQGPICPISRYVIITGPLGHVQDYSGPGNAESNVSIAPPNTAAQGAQQMRVVYGPMQ